MANRFDYVQFDEKQTVDAAELKLTFSILAARVEQLGQGRAQSLALTKLEEAYMWCGKALRDIQIAENGSAKLQEERKDG